MKGSEVDVVPSEVAGVKVKPGMVPADVVILKLRRALKESLVVNVPVRVAPSLNVTPENEYTIFADA